jgi:glycosyltransferase involved in cell wall biosynthesis
VRRHGIEIIHARSRAPAWSGWLAARLAGVGFVTTYHGIYNARSAPKRFYNSIMARGDVVIANSHYTREHVLRSFKVAPERVVAIPRGVDLGVFDPASVKRDSVAALRASWGLRAEDKRCVIIAPARLTRWKGQLVLLEAAHLLTARRPDVAKFIIAGDAQGREAYRDEVLRAIAENQLRESVAVVGHIGQMAAALAASDIAVFPVIEPEAFGRGAVEAQAMGVPVIASSLGGFTETVADGVGVLAPPGDAQALASALERLIDIGPEKRAEMGRAGQSRVQSLYTKTALQQATLAVYRRVIAESGHPGKPGLRSESKHDAGEKA